MRIAPYIFTTIVDVVVIVAFTFLAYHFEHWWIILFSAPFVFYVRGDK